MNRRLGELPCSMVAHHMIVFETSGKSHDYLVYLIAFPYFPYELFSYMVFFPLTICHVLGMRMQ